MTVDDEALRKLEEKASAAILADPRFREEVQAALAERGRGQPADVEAGLRRAVDLAAYRLRRYLSGRSFSSPLSVIVEAERILSSVKADIVAALRGQTPDSDSVAQQILRKLREDLALVEELETFSTPGAKRALFQAYLESGLDQALRQAPGILREALAAEELERQARAVWRKLMEYVREGKLLRFEAARLHRALVECFALGERRTLGRELVKILARR